VHKKVEKFNDYLFIDTYKSDKIKIGLIGRLLHQLGSWYQGVVAEADQ